MTSRHWLGGTLCAAAALTLATTSMAQERERLRARLLQHMADKKGQSSDPNPTRIKAPGTHRFQFTHDGLVREYIVHVPRGAASGKPAPVLIALHGGGGDMDYQAKNYGLIEKSDAAGFIAVFPSGYSRFPGGILATWNAGKCCGQARDKGIDDVGFIKAVIERVSVQTPIDRRRVFATGMSNGGLMSYRLACELPQMIRGIAPVAGTDNTNHCTPSRPVPVIHFHALDDDHVLFNGGAGEKAFRNREAVTEFTSVPATIAKWVALDRSNPTTKRVLSVAGAYCDLHAAGRGGAPVELCVSETGGHSWPGTTGSRAKKKPSQAISANDLMWQFFSTL